MTNQEYNQRLDEILWQVYKNGEWYKTPIKDEQPNSYGMDVQEAKQAITDLFLSIVGEDERIIDSTSDIHAYFITAKHQLRQELKQVIGSTE